MRGGAGVKALLQPANFTLGPDAILNTDMYSWPILLCAIVNENHSRTMAGQAKDISSSPNPLFEVLRRGRH